MNQNGYVTCNSISAEKYSRKIQAQSGLKF